MKNREIREQAKAQGVKFWEIGVAMGVSEATITRWLRVELDTEKKVAMMKAIEQVAREKEAANENADN